MDNKKAKVGKSQVQLPSIDDNKFEGIAVWIGFCELPCARSAIAGEATRRGAHLVFALFDSPRLNTATALGRGSAAVRYPNSGSVSTGHRIIYPRMNSP